MQVIVNLMIMRMSHFMTTQFTQRNTLDLHTLDHLILNYNVCTQLYCIQPIVVIGNRLFHMTVYNYRALKLNNRAVVQYISNERM